MSASISPSSTHPHSASRRPASSVPASPSTPGSSAKTAPPGAEAPALPAGLWVRQVLGFEAPFGFDRLPTVWG